MEPLLHLFNAEPNLDFELPHFSQFQQPDARVDERINDFVLPVFSAAPIPQNIEDIKPEFLFPNFAPFTPPQVAEAHKPSFDLPHYIEPFFPRPAEAPKPEFMAPNFASFTPPQEAEAHKPSFDLPHYLEPIFPRSAEVEKPEFMAPHFVPFIPTRLDERERPSLELPIYSAPNSPKIDEIPAAQFEEPNFAPFISPKVRRGHQKQFKLPVVSNQLHPVLKLFDYLSTHASYEAIKHDALTSSINDLRMLKRHSQLKTRFLTHQFAQFIEEGSALLPRSATFSSLLENDQEQINLLVQFCTDLIHTNTWEALKLNQNPFIERIVACREAAHENVYQQSLLEFKDTIYCFASEILRQEKEQANQFDATPKDLSALIRILPLLASYIRSQTNRLRMQKIHQASKLEFAQWEDRTPIPPFVVKLDHPGKVIDPQQLQQGLLAIQNQKPSVYQLQDYTDQVLSLPESNGPEALIKAKYLLELGKVYYKLNTHTALKRAVSWIDLAITTLGDKVAQNDPILAECYDVRGTVWYKMGELLKETDHTLRRKRIDSSYRDFHRSAPTAKNYVRKVSVAKETEDTDTSISELRQAIHADDDYAEARYQEFLKRFDKLQLDSDRLLHTSFEKLLETPGEILQRFQAVLLKKAQQNTGSVFKITLSSGSAILKIEPEGIFLNRTSTDFLIALLTNGIKKVRIVDASIKKLYFSPHPVKKETFVQMVQSLGYRHCRLADIEKSIEAFQSFELAAFYKSSLQDVKEDLSVGSIRSRLDSHLQDKVIDLHAMAMNQCFISGKREKKQEFFGKALLFACRGLHQSSTHDAKLYFLIKRSLIYSCMGLKNCAASDLEEAIAFAKKDRPRFLNPSLHYTLGCLYQELNRKEEAKEQFYIILSAPIPSCKRNKSKGLYKKAQVKLAELDKNNPAKKEVGNDVAIITEFQDENIREECLQVLRDHYKANSKTHPHRSAPIWDSFIQRIRNTTNVKEFCEVVLSSITAEKFKPKNLIRLANLANVILTDVKDLDQLKDYVLDALLTYQEEEARQHDNILQKLEQAKAAVVRVEAFFNFKTLLRKKLKDGEKIRPGSPIREKIIQLSTHLAGGEMDRPFTLKTLGEIVGEEISADLEIIGNEIAEILDTALDIEIKPFQVKDNVLHIYGQNVFLSQVKEKIEQLLAQDKSIRDIHIIGVHTYIDCSIAWHGINMAIGGQYGEFLLDKNQRLKIDLSGNNGVHGAVLNGGPAATGNNPCDDGHDGLSGNDGDGGQPGGDCCISTVEPVVGFNTTIIEDICLLGGNGGIGSNGQEGGKGAAGVKGRDGRTDVRRGDAAHKSTRHGDIRRGEKGKQSGCGGRGGNAGLGGKGGLSGRLLFEHDVGNLKEHIRQGNGQDGGNGNPGAGGKAGAGAPDGMDYLIVKDRWYKGEDRVWGYGLYCTDGRYWKRHSWRDGTSREKTISRNQGKEKGRGKTVEEQSRRRREQTKNELKKELFAANLAHHIHTEAPEQRAYAFKEVTDRRAVAHETEEVLKEQLAAKQKKLKDIETLHQTSAALLHQAQHQQQAQTQHSRIAAHHFVDKRVNFRKEIVIFFKIPERDLENVLPFLHYSPIIHAADKMIIHDLECAMHEVNMTHGQNMPAIAKLINEIAHLSNETPIDKEKRDLLINKLLEIVQNIPLKYASMGFDLVQNACKEMEADDLKKAIAEKGLQVAAFNKSVDEESEALNLAYNGKMQDMILKTAILNFLNRDRLFFSLLNKKMEELVQAKKKKWLEKRINKKIISLLWQLTGSQPTQSMIDQYVNFTLSKVRDIESKLPQKKFKEVLSFERKQLQNLLTKQRHERDWLVENLPVLIEQNTSPKQLLAQGIEVEEIYLRCTKLWANIPSLPKEGAISPPLNQEDLTPLAKWMNEVKKENWSTQQIVIFEGHIKQLIDLKSHLGDIDPYLHQLKAIYAVADAELAEIFVSLVRFHKSLIPCMQVLDQLKSEDSNKIYLLRKEYLSRLEENQEIFTKIYLYLQKRNIILIKNECKKAFHQDVDELLNEVLQKVNGFYDSHTLFPDIDFLAIAKEVIVKNARRICEEDFNVFDPIIKQIVGDELIDLNDHSKMVHSLESGIRENQLSNIKKYLFLLANCHPPFSHVLNIIKILGDNVNKSPLIKDSHHLFLQIANEEKLKFGINWHLIIERAKMFDQLREQLQENHESVEGILFQIARNIDLLPLERKIEALNQVKVIMSMEGCFLAIPKLKSLQDKLIAEIAVFASADPGVENCILNYHNALKDEHEAVRKTIPSLFMKIVEVMPFDKNFLKPLQIVLHHLPFQPSYLITLYSKLASLNDLDDHQKALKKECLDTIRKTLNHHLDNEYTTFLQIQNDRKADLRKHQVELLTRISDVIKSSQILYPDRNIAKIELWIKLLDFHFEIDMRNDDNGTKRKEIYQKAEAQFLELMKSRDTSKAIDLFQTWLSETYNNLLGRKADLNAFKALLDQMPEKEAQLVFKKIYWRGAIPFSAAEDETSVLSLLEGRNFSEEIETLFKLKFDEALVQEECYQVKQELETIQKKEQEKLEAWFLHVQSKLSSDKITPVEMDTIYPLRGLKQVQIPANFVAKPEENVPDLQGGKKVIDYLEELEKKINSETITDEDSILLKNLRQFALSLRENELLRKIEQLQLKIITLNDKKTAQCKEVVAKFLEVIHRVNSYKKDLEKCQDAFSQQIVKNIERLKKSLSSCMALMGEEAFIDILNKLINSVQEPINLLMLTNLFWVLPRLQETNALDEIATKRLPENWALSLLEMHCLESVQPLISRLALELPTTDLFRMTDGQKDEWINNTLKEKQKQAEKCLTDFKEILTRLLSTNALPTRDKELLLRIISERLTSLNQGKLGFSIEGFVKLLDTYMTSQNVLKILPNELANPHSTIANGLCHPSFESFKYALTQAWIKGMLVPSISRLGAGDQQKLFASLFEIETTKKEEKLREVVEALKGDVMTPAVVECVAQFAKGSWELDQTALALLKNRTASGEWYSEIEAYTKMKRSKPRDLQTLIKLMEEESTGINKSINDLLVGDNPQLLKDIEDIKQEFELVKNWDAEQITNWANESRGENFLNDPTLLKKGIALVSRACQIIENKKLRDTQFIALWLKLRKKEGIQRGRIGQMDTGEGKSIVFACLDVLKALAKSHTDNTTTSTVLAEREPRTKKALFTMFGLTVANNCDLECEMNENVRKQRYFQDGKPVDVVFGDVASFERDLLLTEFHGKEIIHQSRLGSNRSVAVDEVDGLFLDNAGMVLYLSHDVDALRFVERIFAHIWKFSNDPHFDKATPFDDSYVEAILKMIKEKIDSGEIALPKYEVQRARYMEMRAVIDRKLPLWIRSALYAKSLRPNNEYIVINQVVRGKKKKAITVMDKGTGVEQLSLKWSNGLHQFLQLKHGLELNPESLKAVFLSNYFFFKRYGSQIYGLSGTLGSDAEQQYLQDLYQVDLFKIPRFMGEKFIQYKPTVAADIDEWFTAIEKSVKREIRDKKRAVLLICESVEEVTLLKDNLKSQYPLLKTYTSSFEELSYLSHDKENPVCSGDLIIATNLAGRGTDLKTAVLLESYGGLHVIVSYLPPNIRIQIQALRRTARAGNEGSGELIVIDPQRRPFDELCRLRDLAEKQRLESVAMKELKKIEFENELLRGFLHNGEQIPGFQNLLNLIQQSLQGSESFYREAQLNSLKNRWAFWIDHMEDKITMVYALGKDHVVASFKQFYAGVMADFHSGGFRLVKEPVELIKLGGEYRRGEKWSEAANCYSEAAKDPHYAYALYYKGACDFIKSPSSCFSAKLRFKADAKKAIPAIKSEIAQMQTALQMVTPLVEQRRLQTGDPDYGNPFKARGEERIQVWSIFLSAIDGAIGGSISEETLRNSPFVKEGDADKILRSLGGDYKPTRLSKKLVFKGDKVFFKGKEISVPKIFKPILLRLNGVRKIDKKLLQTYCRDLVTQESALRHLNCNAIKVYKLSPITKSFENWPAGSTESVKFVLEDIVKYCSFETYPSHDAIKTLLREKFAEHPILAQVNVESFFDAMVRSKIIIAESMIDLKGTIVNENAEFDSSKNAMKGFTRAYSRLPAELQNALAKACLSKKQINEKWVWFLNSSICLRDLNLPKSIEEAADILWTQLEGQDVIKPAKIKMVHSQYKHQAEKIKGDLKGIFRGNAKAEEAVNSVFEIIDSSIGMIYKLDNKKTTAKFAEIVRKFYYDNRQNAPEGLGQFIELGLEVIADLIEKKDPPKWYELLTVAALGVMQMVAGTIIKAYIPVVGDLIGNTLMNSGMDDVMFAVTSAATKEFSWDDYASAKKDSLKRSLVSSAITCGVSFGVNAAKLGSVSKAWQVQKLSGVQKMVAAGKVVPGTFNLGSHIVKEMGRSFISMGISQLASRGLEGMVKLISCSYERNISDSIERAVNNFWHLVKSQANALYEKLDGDHTVQGNVQGCLDVTLNKLRSTNFFDSAIRASRQVLPQTSSLIGNKGWSHFISHAPDIANLGISISKMNHLVENSVHTLAREIRETRDRKEAVISGNRITKEAFDGHLEKLKGQYIEQLTQAFNGMLHSAVYAPLISMGAKYLSDKVTEKLMPLSEQERLAQSIPDLANILEIEGNADNAFYDEALRKWRDVNDEVTHFSKDDLKKTPVNSEETIETLRQQYGDLLKIYKDRDGQLYAQRPKRNEYAEGVLKGKASSDPEIVALCKIFKRNIVVTTPDGKMKTYSQDGNIVVSERGEKQRGTIYLKVEGHDGIGHVTVEGSKKKNKAPHTGQDCLYEAVKEATRSQKSVKTLRELTSDKLRKDNDCKRFYHDWSLSSEPKQFVGKDWNLGTRLFGLVRVVGGAGEMAAGGYITIQTVGLGAIPGYAFMVHGADECAAGTKMIWTGEEVDSLTTQLLNKGIGLSHQNAQLTNELIGLASGPAALYKMSKTIKLQEKALADLTKKLDSLVHQNNGIGQLPTLRNLHIQLAAEQIASGHAFGKHAREFSFATKDQMAGHIERVMARPDRIHLGRGIKPEFSADMLPKERQKLMWDITQNRTAYWDNVTKSIVIRDPKSIDGGTCFVHGEGLNGFLFKVDKPPFRPIDWLRRIDPTQ